MNGAGEICNRDIEILSVGSVLLRPKLKQIFHDPLIENFHYISFENGSTPKEQLEIIRAKYEEIKTNHDLLNTVAKNGLDWYKRNGTINANVEILKKIININKLK